MENGRLIHIWKDKWLPTPSTYKVITHPRDFDGFPMVSSLIDQETKWWKTSVVRALFLPFEADAILSSKSEFAEGQSYLDWE